MTKKNGNVFRILDIPPDCKNYFDLDALKYWLIANLKVPNLAFPYGDCLITPYKTSEYIKQLWCTFHYSQNLHPKQLEKHLELWKNILNELCEQRRSRKVYPSLLIPCPNMGPTSFTWPSIRGPARSATRSSAVTTISSSSAPRTAPSSTGCSSATRTSV